MTNSRARGHTLLFSYTAAGAEATKTYTPSAIMLQDKPYKYFKFAIAGESTGAFSLTMLLSGDSDNNIHTILNDSDTISGTSAAAAGTIDLLPIALNDAANRIWLVTGEIHFASDSMITHAHATASEEGQAIISAETITISGINAIVIATSTSTWKAGTTIKIWGIA